MKLRFAMESGANRIAGGRTGRGLLAGAIVVIALLAVALWCLCRR